MFELKRSKPFDIKLYDKVFTISKPKFVQLEENDVEIKESDPLKVKVRKAVQTLALMGIPEEFVNDMDSDDVLTVLEHINTKLDEDKKKATAGKE